MFYCQKDGGQWNVPVTVDAIDDVTAIIHGPTLAGTFTDSSGNGWLIVNKDTVHETEQA